MQLKLKIEMVITAVVADMFLLVGELDVFVEHRPQGEPHLAVLANEDLFRLSQVVVVKVHTQAATKWFIRRTCLGTIDFDEARGLSNAHTRRRKSGVAQASDPTNLYSLSKAVLTGQSNSWQ